MSEEPPTKRARRHSSPIEIIDRDLQDESLCLSRSNIWMPYGDIIIQAESTLFRVNKDILARHSSVFDDMFILPQPKNEELLEGCPITFLSDTALDVQLLLTAFYDPYHHKTSQPFDLVASMLRLGHKYDITKFRNDALSRMHHDFPSSFFQWDRRNVSKPEILLRHATIIDCLNLAYERGVYTSIPALGFLCLHKYSLQQLFDGLERADGSQATLLDHTKLVLALALEKMQLFQRTNVSWIKDDELIPSACCKSRTKCIKEQAVMARVECLDRKVDVSFLLESWSKAGEGKWKGRLCASCEEAAKMPYDVARKKAWGMLPSFFALVPWEELTDAD